MHYSDEDVIRIVQEAQNSRKIHCNNQITIYGIDYFFSEPRIFEEKFSVFIPDAFLEMPDYMVEEKYPSKYRPKIIYTNEDGSINISFNYKWDEIKPDEIKDCLIGFKSVIKRMNPAFTFYDIEEYFVEDLPMGYFDYRSYALDDDVYNILFVTAIDSRLLYGTFSCLFKQKDQLKLLALRMINSISEVGED